jgi:hypothetical protein
VQCNIDARGRAVRRNGGILCLALGLLSSGAAVSGAPRRAFLGLGVFLILSGLFQLFEARKGWCVARAMGFKTSI